MELRVVLLMTIVVVALVECSHHEELRVRAPIGEIFGSTLTSRLGKTIYAFRGLRYAQPPIGKLRFKPPVPIDHYEGLYNATDDGFICPQPGFRPVSEDCLFLNVYTTKLPSKGTNPKRPVIIHLHPGAFYSSTGHSRWAGPQYLLDQDIVLVTLNYRLGSLGFISTGRDAPGNNGLKDQVIAMRWVQRNIATFGGDPNSVTLYGYSAGAWSVTLHLVSPMSQGLFHKGIIGAGSPLGIWPLPKNQIELAKKQARIMGCPDDSPSRILECLKTKSAVDIGDSLFEFFDFGGIAPVLVWSPVIEEDFGQERFLAEDPVEMIKDNRFQKMPLISGITKDEFGYMAIRLEANQSLLQQLSDNFDKYAPIVFIYEQNTPKSHRVSQAVKKFYFDNGPITNSSFNQLVELFKDAITGYNTYRGVELLSAKNTQPVYYYNFTYQGRYSNYYLPNTTTPWGVVHHDDLMYEFYISPQFPFFNASYVDEAKMVDTLTSILASFAKSGRPIPEEDPKFAGVHWTPFSNGCKKILDIGEKLVLKDFRSKAYEFWNGLYPLW